MSGLNEQALEALKELASICEYFTETACTTLEGNGVSLNDDNSFFSAAAEFDEWRLLQIEKNRLPEDFIFLTQESSNLKDLKTKQIDTFRAELTNAFAILQSDTIEKMLRMVTQQERQAPSP